MFLVTMEHIIFFLCFSWTLIGRLVMCPDNLMEEDCVCGRFLFVLKLTKNRKIISVKFDVL